MTDAMLKMLAEKAADTITRNSNKIEAMERLSRQLADWLYNEEIGSHAAANLWAADVMILAQKRGESFVDTFLVIQSQARIIAESYRDESPTL